MILELFIKKIRELVISQYTISVILYYLVNIISTLLLSYICGIKIYGEFIYIVSIFSIISYLTTFRLEILITNHRESDEKENYFGQQIYFIIFLSLILSGIITIIRKYITFFEINYDYIYFIKIFSFIATPSLMIVLNQYFLIHGNYKRTTILKFLPTVLVLIIQILFLKFSNTFQSLITGTTLANIIIIIFIYINQTKYIKIDLLSFFKFLKSQKKSILVLLPSSFLNTINQQLPSILIMNFANSYTLGSYSLINKLFGAPSSVIAPFILERHKLEINNDHENNINLISIFNRVTSLLFILSLLSFIASLFFYFFKFPQYIFQNKERFSILLLFTVYSFRFIVSPLTYFIFFSNKIKYDLIIQILHFLMILVFVINPIKYNIVNYLNTVQITIYFLYFFILKRLIKIAT